MYDFYQGFEPKLTHEITSPEPLMSQQNFFITESSQRSSGSVCINKKRDFSSKSLRVRTEGLEPLEALNEIEVVD